MHRNGADMAASKRKSARRPASQPVEDAPTIEGFCFRKRISRSSYINYRKLGVGPAETRAVPGGRVIITKEAEAAWDRAHTALASAITE
jgi:hypothetical protein